MCIAQNGPGITNFVTGLRCRAHPHAHSRTHAHTVLSAGVAAAYWAHSPVVCITPEAGSATKGYGGFQVL